MENLTENDERSLEKIIELFNASNLKTVKSLAKRLVITRATFVGLILAAKSGDLETMPYNHQMNCFEYVPDHLIPTEEDMDAFHANDPGEFKGKARTFVNKIFQTFEERKWIVWHLFYTSSQEYWHLFYFDIKDMNEENNHWKIGGPHVHYISNLWPQFTISDVWERLRSGSKEFGSNVHIRFVD